MCLADFEFGCLFGPVVGRPVALAVTLAHSAEAVELDTFVGFAEPYFETCLEERLIDRLVAALKKDQTAAFIVSLPSTP